MRYVVYVNHPTNKAMVHKSTCGRFVNRKRDRTTNGFWKMYFDSFNSAMGFAHNTNKKNVDSCAICY